MEIFFFKLFEDNSDTNDGEQISSYVDGKIVKVGISLEQLGELHRKLY